MYGTRMKEARFRLCSAFSMQSFLWVVIVALPLTSSHAGPHLLEKEIIWNISDVSISPRRRYVCIAAPGKAIVWDTIDWRSIRKFNSPFRIGKAAVTDKYLILSPDEGGILHIIPIGKSASRKVIRLGSALACRHLCLGKNGVVYVATNGPSIRVYDLSSSELLYSIPATKRISHIFWRDERLLIVLENRTLMYWDTKERKFVSKLNSRRVISDVTGLLYRRHWVIAAGSAILLVDTENGRVRALADVLPIMHDIDISPSNESFLSVHIGSVRLWKRNRRSKLSATIIYSVAGDTYAKRLAARPLEAFFVSDKRVVICTHSMLIMKDLQGRVLRKTILNTRD